VKRIQVRIDQVILDTCDARFTRSDVAAGALAEEIRRTLACPVNSHDVVAIVRRAVQTTFGRSRARP
jgi:hypothetical protein